MSGLQGQCEAEAGRAVLAFSFLFQQSLGRFILGEIDVDMSPGVSEDFE